MNVDNQNILDRKIESPYLRAIWLNCAVIPGIVLGLWNAPHTISAEATGRVAVFFFAFTNLLFLIAQRRQRSLSSQRTLFREAWATVAERPVITALVIMQLWAVARCVGSVIILSRAYSSPQAAAQNLRGRVVLAGVLLVIVGFLWLASAAGLWQTKMWAWWVALVLNVLSAGISILLQMFKLDQFLIDPVATLMVVLLLWPATRRLFKTYSVAHS